MHTFKIVALMALVLTVTTCSRQQPPPTGPASLPPPPSAVTAPPLVERLEDAEPVASLPILSEEAISNRSLEDLNRESPLQPILFQLDSADLDEIGQAVAAANAEILMANGSWIVTVEGHCDERGTAEYNLALGERRAVAVRTYLVSLGVPVERFRTVSYGKEFPFDSGHNEEAWKQNRRAQFVITSNQ